uniref:uncharacterized protein LOC114677129 n=1 Tax=Macaca mulatta TaxID=9544 RepID=UPI0010A299E9|nr:uncharacterized protein LOC114677129 [Macaca mulatta]
MYNLPFYRSLIPVFFICNNKGEKRKLVQITALTSPIIGQLNLQEGKRNTEKEENVWGRLGFREAEGGGGRPGHCDFLVRCLWEEDGPEVLKGPFQPPTTNAGGGVGEVRKQPRRDKSLMLPVELDRAVNKPGQLWRQVGAPVGSTVAEAALPPPSPPPPPRPLRYWGKRCRCDRGGRGWSSRRLQRAGAAEPCLDAQSRH